LAFGTLHTNIAIQTINRIIDVFPSRQQGQVRAVLSFVLEGVITQTLLPKASGSGRALAAEVMVPNAAIRNLIREDKLHQIYSQMQIGQSKFGMMTMNQSLVDLYIRKVISLDVCMAASSEQDELKTMILSAGGSIGNMAAPANARR
ncbi:MAG: type IV pili twitching motility protein PilT, partial [Deltaproteobacteria bacterium]|nr:type IV pili twitching motility protein PilT [Deltaproteobacteria bacterium]